MKEYPLHTRRYGFARTIFAPALLSLCLFLFSYAAAQEENPSAQESVIRLSEFRVDTSADEGYRATNTISGTRLNTPIRDVPMPIEVITEEFIRDIGAIDFREALRYSAGVLLDSHQDAHSGATMGLQDDTESKLKLRGFVTNEQLRNGFQRAHPGDIVNISRVEVVRGPAALLYGIGNFGGIVNYIAKRPLAEPSYQINVHSGNQDYFRMDFDATGPVAMGDLPAAYRVMGAWTNRGHWTDFHNRRTKYFAPVFEFQPFENTIVTIDAEYSRDKQEGIGFRHIWGSSDRNVNNRLGSEWLPVPNPHTFRWSGPDTFRESENYSLMLEVEHRVTDNLSFLAGGLVAESEVESLTIIDPSIVSGQGPSEYWTQFRWFSLNFGDMTVNDASLRSRWERTEARRPRYQTRIEGTYQFDTGNFLGEHSLLLGRSDSLRSTHFQSERADWNFRRISDVSYFRLADNDNPFVPFQNNTNRFYDQGHYLVHQGSFWDGRIQTVSGLRHDRSDTLNIQRNAETGETTSESRRPTNEPATEWTPQFGLSFKINENLSVYALRSGGLLPNYTQLNGLGEPFDPITAKSYEAGVKFDFFEGRVSGTMSSYRVDRENHTRNIWWAPNVSVGMYDPNQPIVYAAFPHTAALAAHFDWAHEGQLTLLHWDDPEDRARIYEFVDATRDPDHALYRSTTPRFLGRWEEGFGNGANFPGMDRGANVSVDDKSQGFDAQIFLSITDNWQTVLTYAYVDRWITHDARLIKYPHPHTEVEQWYQNFYAFQDNSFGEMPGRNEVAVADTSSYMGNDQLTGIRLDDTPYNQFSIWNRYDFTEGIMTGFNAAIGVRYMGPREVQGLSGPDGSGATQRGEVGPIMSPEDITLDLALGYERQFGNQNWRFRLNVDNLLDEQKRITDIAGFPGQDNVGAGISFKDPRQIRLTAGVQF